MKWLLITAAVVLLGAKGGNQTANDTSDAHGAHSRRIQTNHHPSDKKVSGWLGNDLEPGSRSLGLCRLPDGVYLPLDLFVLDTCARCYSYIPNQATFFKADAKWNRTAVARSTDAGVFNVTFLRRDQLVESADIHNPISPIRASFQTAKAVEMWTSCCQRAAHCCQSMNDPEIDPTTTTPTTDTTDTIGPSPYGSATCPPTWDGWTCWQQSLPDQVALAPCPDYIYFETEPPACPRYATKTCTSNGTWFRRGGFEKTNYSPCSPVSLLELRTIVHISAYAISTAALLPALIIFYSYKQLNVYRIRLHKNMFISILINCVLVIIMKVVIILPQLTSSKVEDSYIKQNAIGCRILFMLTRYFRMTNYMWMFCEGFYLHRLISAAFAEEKSFIVFYILGWAFPVIPSVIYAAVRALFYDTNCWVTPIEAYEWVLNAPCLISLVVNMIFLVNIIRILVIKLRTAHCNEPSQYRKAVRATLVLVPLFGLHFMVTIYRPTDKGCEWIEIYHYVNALLDGLQGCLVAIIFCYANGEIHYLLKRSYQRYKEERCPGRSTRLTTFSNFLGRSIGSSTHISVADSPNPQKAARIHMTTAAMPTIVSEDSREPLRQKNNRETCVDDL